MTRHRVISFMNSAMYNSSWVAMMRMSGFRRQVNIKIRHGATSLRRLIRLNGLKPCCIITGLSLLVDSHPIMCTCYFPEQARLSPIFSYILESSTGLRTDVITILLLFESAIRSYKGLTVNH